MAPLSGSIGSEFEYGLLDLIGCFNIRANPIRVRVHHPFNQGLDFQLTQAIAVLAKGMAEIVLPSEIY